jgi:hypothetical protein
LEIVAFQCLQDGCLSLVEGSFEVLADSDEAARLKRDNSAQGFLDDAAPL